MQELITETQPDNWVHVVGVRAIDRTGASVDIRLAPPRSDGTQGVAIIALGTIESTRLALTTFQNSLAGRAAQRMGENLLAHLRSNLTIRIPKEALAHLPKDTIKVLQASALFVKGKATINGKDRYFHLQIAASGLSDLGNNSEALLFKKIPDVDQVRAMTEADNTSVVLTLRGIGEMTPMNPDSRVGLAQTPGDIDFGRPAAYAVIGNALAPTGGSPQTQADRDLWDAMDAFADQVALIFAKGKPFEILTNRLGITINVPAGATAADLTTLREKDKNRHHSSQLRASDRCSTGLGSRSIVGAGSVPLPATALHSSTGKLSPTVAAILASFTMPLKLLLTSPSGFNSACSTPTIRIQASSCVSAIHCSIPLPSHSIA